MTKEPVSSGEGLYHYTVLWIMVHGSQYPRHKACCSAYMVQGLARYEHCTAWLICAPVTLCCMSVALRLGLYSGGRWLP